MLFDLLWKRIRRALHTTPARRQRAAESTRLELERLESRWLPANIYITGNVTNGIIFTDGGRFDDGASTPLVHLNGSTNYLAKNLRSAVDGATNLAGSNTIFLESNTTNTYMLNNGELEVQFGPATALTINNMSGGSNFSTISGSGNPVSPFRLFEVDSGGTTTLDHLLLTNGLAPSPTNGMAMGGAILNHGSLTLTNDQITGNTATGFGKSSAPQIGAGGGVFSGPDGGPAGQATLTIKSCLFDANTATGGTNTDSAGIGANGEGGAIFLGNTSGAASIQGSTFTNNKATGGDGGQDQGAQGGLGLGGALALAQISIHLDILNSTFAANSAHGGLYDGGDAYGGALLTQNQNQVNLVNDTIATNQSFGGEGTHSDGTGFGGGVANFGGITVNPPSFVNVVNTIIAKNMADGKNDDLFGTFESLGHNFIGAATGTGFTAPGDQTGTSDIPIDPGLDPNGLADNGGPTQTIALLPTSNAINKGDNGVVRAHSALLRTLGIARLSTDQRGRGFPRLVDSQVDIGAFEFQMNLNKHYAFQGRNDRSVTLTVGAPGLLLGSSKFPPPGGGSYQVIPYSSTPIQGTTLQVHADGSFSLTVPAQFQGTVQFKFRLRVGDQDTNLVFTAIIEVISPPENAQNHGQNNGG